MPHFDDSFLQISDFFCKACGHKKIMKLTYGIALVLTDIFKTYYLISEKFLLISMFLITKDRFQEKLMEIYFLFY